MQTVDRWIAMRIVALVVIATLTVPTAAEGGLGSDSGSTSCIGGRSADTDLDAIVAEIFRNTPKRLLQQKIIDQRFFDAIRTAQYEICDDRTWDVVTLPRTAPLVVFDSSFLRLLTQESQTLILGQYLSNDYPDVPTLALHREFMLHVLAQNMDRTTPLLTLAQLVDNVTGHTIDINKYLATETFRRRLSTVSLNAFYFLIFHEFCHIEFGHPQRRTQISAMPDRLVPAGATKQSMLAQLEKDADSCAIDIINRDEARSKFSPISFFSASMVASTQGVLEKVLPTQAGMATHPAPQERIDNAYRRALTLVDESPDAKRYKQTLAATYEHFSKVIPK